ncbi:hypothetical protein OH77DRAFT_1022766 [Trametes cingulata]|nr:hypothetical protein OH77DRAFT_1022766 [Trametes cingulata]
MEVQTLGQRATSLCCRALPLQFASDGAPSLARHLCQYAAHIAHGPIMDQCPVCVVRTDKYRYLRHSILFGPAQTTAAGADATECCKSQLHQESLPKRPRSDLRRPSLAPGWTLFRVNVHARTIRLQSSTPGRSLVDRRRYGSWAPLARTPTLADDLAWRLCWKHRSSDSTKLSSSRRTTRRTSELRRLRAGARTRDCAEGRIPPPREPESFANRESTHQSLTPWYQLRSIEVQWLPAWTCRRTILLPCFLTRHLAGGAHIRRAQTCLRALRLSAFPCASWPRRRLGRDLVNLPCLRALRLPGGAFVAGVSLVTYASVRFTPRHEGPTRPAQAQFARDHAQLTVACWSCTASGRTRGN